MAVRIGNVSCGRRRPLVWIAGPCVIESHDLTLRIADTAAQSWPSGWQLPLVFKASFDKANRTSGKSFRGPGPARGAEDAGRGQAAHRPAGDHRHPRMPARRRRSAEVCDLLQIPAFLARQTDLIQAAGSTGRAVNVKKGQFMAPWDMKQRRRQDGRGRQPPAAADRARHDLRLRPAGQRHALASRWMQELGCPVIFDATHSVQMPGGPGGPQRRRPAHGAVPGPGGGGRAAATACSWRRTRARRGPQRRAEHGRRWTTCPPWSSAACAFGRRWRDRLLARRASEVDILLACASG